MSEPNLNRVPPQSREAERCVLGSMLRDNTVIDVVTNIVQIDNFYFDAHRKIFEAIRHIWNNASPVDLIILAEYLRGQQQLEEVGNYAYLAELWEAAPTAANAEHYARIVRDKGITRALIHASTEILRDAYDQAAPADQLLESAERQILEIAQMGATGHTTDLVTALDEAYARIDQRTAKAHTAVSGVPTGFVDLDEKTAGMQANELIILAARPSVGKTAFALNIVRHVVVEEHIPAFFVSLEQSRVEIAERLLCCQARVDSHRLRTGRLSSEDMDRLMDAGGLLRQARLFIDDTPAQNMLRIAANARRLQRQHDIRLIVIDYLQLIEPENRRDPRQEQVAQISRRLKFLARELKLPVMALAQVNRSSEDRQDHRPRLADLRESGCLAGDTLVTMADTGARVPMHALVGRRGFRVWAMDEETLTLKPAIVSNAFATGRKPVFRLETGLGRAIRATTNHRFRTDTGWKRLDEIQVGDYLAVPRRLTFPIAGSMSRSELAQLGRLNVAVGDYQSASLELSQAWHERTVSVMTRSGISTRALQPAASWSPCGSVLYPSTDRCSLRSYASVGIGGEQRRATSATSDVYWDQVRSIVPAGEEEVFDLTVPGPANFVANGIIAHNSIEQDADTVMLLHRPGRFDGGQEDNVIEVIIGKQRNGPTGEVTLAYLKQFMRYENYAVGDGFGLDM